MPDIIFEEMFSDRKAFEYLDEIEKKLVDLGKTAEKTGDELDDALSPGSGQFGLGVTDVLDEIKKKYAELQRASLTLRAALRNSTDPSAIKLYRNAINDLDNGMKTLETSAKKAGVSLKEVNKDVGIGKQVFREFFGEFTKAALITVAIQKVIEFTNFAVELADQTRLATKQFEAFLGSAERAGQVVSDLQGFAADKFLNTGEVLQAGRALLAFGENADDLTPVLSRVADISAATGKNFNELVTIYGKARAAGVLYAEDINQLVDAGIPIIQEFAKQMGVSNDAIKKLASEGKISFEELQLAFFNLTKEGGRFADQAELNAFTISGAWRGLLAELQPIIEGVGDFFSFAAQRIVNTTKDLVKDVKSLFGIGTEEVGAFFDIQVDKEKQALDEQTKLEEAAERRRKELAAQNLKNNEDAARKRRQQRIDEFNRLLQDVDAQAEALDIAGTFNPVERVQKEYAAALSSARDLEKSLLKLADTQQQRDAVRKSIEALFDELLAEYSENLSKAEIELEKLKGGKIREALNPLPPLETLKRDVTDVLKSLSAAADEFIKSQEPRSLAEILGLTEEGLAGLKTAGKEIIDSLNEIAEARVREAEAATRAADEKVRAAQEALIKEQEIAAEGLANNVKLRQDELDAAKQQRDAALKEEQKARRTQILLDSVQQISSLITASANIFKSLSSIPFVGIPLAIATIATMFGAFAKAKTDALKASNVPKFRKGTKLDGRTHEEGGLGIINERGELIGEAEGDEWLIGTAPSREHDAFLHRLNKGEFAGRDLDRLVPKPGQSRNPLSEAAPRIARIERERREMEQGQHMVALATAYEKTAAKIVSAIENKEVVYPWRQGYKVRRRRGNVTETETVTPE